jgi:predicted DNA-binding transcriptional regulator AlpA
MEQTQSAAPEVAKAQMVDTHKIAAIIDVGHKRFLNMLSANELPDFPNPAPLPGRRRWFLSHVEEWLSRIEEETRKGTVPQPTRPGRKPGRPRQVEQHSKPQQQGGV